MILMRTSPLQRCLRPALVVLVSTAISGCEPATGPQALERDAAALNRADASRTLPIRRMPHLQSITFYERTEKAAPDAYTFSKDDPRLLSRVGGPLNASNADFQGVLDAEFYDVFFSDAHGNPDADGGFLTIEATFDRAAEAGLNIAAIQVNFAHRPMALANRVMSSVGLGAAVPSSVGNAVDGDLQTHTSMGNTYGGTQRMRLTVGLHDASERGQ
jgi:hypothetical protein